MKICNFNVNSVRAREDLILNWLEHRRLDIDVLCLQEIKCVEGEFPRHTFEKLGFHCEINGQRGYNGVATCSKIPLEVIERGFGEDQLDREKRVISVKAGNVFIINVYAPHGDLRGTNKFYYKIDWYNRLLHHLNEKYSPKEGIMIMGDFNVARDEIDVYDPAILEDTVGTMREGREIFQELLN